MLYPQGHLDAVQVQAIAVPGGDYDEPTPERPFAVADRESYGRGLLAAWLYITATEFPLSSQATGRQRLCAGSWRVKVFRPPISGKKPPLVPLTRMRSSRRG